MNSDNLNLHFQASLMSDHIHAAFLFFTPAPSSCTSLRLTCELHKLFMLPEDELLILITLWATSLTLLHNGFEI